MASTETVQSAWADYPGYRIDLVPLEGIGRVHAGATLLAESSRCLIVRESDHRDQLYFPVEDVIAELLPSEHRTTCPFKGVADHWSIETDTGLLENIVWRYPKPFDEVAGIEGFVSFYFDRVSVTACCPFRDGDESVTGFPAWGTADDLLALMDPEPVAEDEDQPGTVASASATYRTPIYPDPPLGTFFDWARRVRSRNVIEGGQLLGAAIVAGAKARPDLHVTWASIVFAKAAHWDTPIDVELELRRSGRSIAAMDARVVQDGVLRATATVMSDVGSDHVIRHSDAPPEVPGPTDCPANNFGVIGREYRVVDGAYQHQDVAGPPVMYVWSRFAHDPGPQHLHQAAHAQASTHWAIATALRPYPDITEADAHVTVSTGPLAVAVAFHDELDATEWLLTEVRSIYAGAGTSQAHTRTFSADGRLVSSSTVQAMIRPFVRPPEAMGHDSTTAM